MQFATQQQLAETHCKYFARHGACPWGGKCDHLHVADVIRFRAVRVSDGDGWMAERFLTPVVFASKNAKPNAKMTSAAIDDWRKEIFAQRKKRNDEKDVRRQVRVTLLKAKTGHQQMEQDPMVAEEATKLLKDDAETRRELAKQRLLAHYGADPQRPAGNFAITDPWVSRKRDRQYGLPGLSSCAGLPQSELHQPPH